MDVFSKFEHLKNDNIWINQCLNILGYETATIGISIMTNLMFCNKVLATSNFRNGKSFMNFTSCMQLFWLGPYSTEQLGIYFCRARSETGISQRMQVTSRS